jgi:hypothetical protein
MKNRAKYRRAIGAQLFCTWPAAQDHMPCGCAGCGSHIGCDHPDAAVLLFARMLIWLAIGADSAIVTAYIAE